MSAQDKYIQAIQNGLGLAGYHAHWPLGAPVSLGGIGTMVRSAFDERGHLQDFVEVSQGPTGAQSDGLTYADGKGVDVSVTVGGRPARSWRHSPTSTCRCASAFGLRTK